MNYQKSRSLDFWPLFFLLASLEAAVALLTLINIPSEGVGISPTRLALLVPLMIAIILSVFASYFSWRNDSFRANWLDPDTHPRLYKFLSAGFPIITAGTSVGAFLLRWWDPERLLPFFERAWPLLAFIIVFSVQATVWLLVLKHGIHKLDFEERKPALIAFAILLFVLIFVGLTKLGLTPDPAYWGEPGVPIQGWQLGLALILGTSFLPLSLLPLFKSNSRRTDIILGILIWAVAVGIWVSEPNEVLKNSFYFPIDPPTNMPLPYSDSGYYDSMAHSLLIGTDYMGNIPTRPLYILLLTGLHLLFGENYNSIIIGQTVVLAIYPVIFYAIGSKLHSRLAGFTIALLAIFREWTNLLVSSGTRVSNVKTFLVDTPTLLLILLTCFFAFRWMERKDKRSAFIAGGTFGVLLLLRTQSMLIVPFILFIAILVFRLGKRSWLMPLFVFIFGIAICIMPWLSHNYLRIGSFSFDAPFQYQVLASQYAYTGNLDFNAVDLENKSLSQILITFIIKDPKFVAQFMVNHFLATEVGAMFALPLIYPFNGLRSPVNIYWTTFNGILSWQNILLLIGYLIIIAIGLGTSWKRWRWAGLLPLAFNVGYATANGVGRFSGWRYDLPADWIAYFYFGIGFAQILFWIANVFGFQPQISRHTDYKEIPKNNKTSNIQIAAIAAFFALMGFLPWIAEEINPPPRYQDYDPTTIYTKIAELQDEVSPEEIQIFGAQLESSAHIGRLLYPRTFSGNGGIVSTTPWPSYAPRDYPRLGFKLLNQGLTDVVFPNRGVPIENVQGEGVILLGCQRDDYIEARLLVFPNRNLTYLSDRALQTCSP